MPLTAETFASVVLEDIDGTWELHQGKLRDKPPMSVGHNELASLLGDQITDQVDRSLYRVRHNAGHVTAPVGNTYVPDLAVIPLVLIRQRLDNPTQLERSSEPLPFVVELWSPSTGSYDVDAKIPAYQARGDAEIWRLHPFEPSLRR